MANEEHLALLKQGAETWNQWRKQHKKITPDLVKANLHDLNLSNVNLNQANIAEANLSQTNLSATQLINANLQGANLLGADLRGANLRGANLDYAIFSQAKIDLKTIIHPKSRQIWEIVNQTTTNKNFAGIDLSNANLFRADLSNTDLSNANLNHSNLSHANLRDAYLYKADLTGANLCQADLTNAYFSHANLTKAYLGGASCCGTYLKDAELKFANLKTAKISPKTMIDLKWYSVWEVVNQGAVKKNLSGADLSNANLQGVDFAEANLTNANLSHSILRASNLERANLTNTDLVGANLCGVALDRANLTKTKLKAVVSDKPSAYGKANRLTHLPAPMNTAKTNLAVKEQPEVATTIITTSSTSNQSVAKGKGIGWIFCLGILILIVIAGYILLGNNFEFPWQQQPLELEQS